MELTTPKVSVIIITYNRAHLLGAAMTSVLNQTFQDFELIVVDDASQDNTADVVRSFRDDRIRYIRHDTNKRVAGARNTGLQNSMGEYIAFLDDDDEWLPEKLQRQVDLLDSCSPVVGGVYTGFIQVDRSTGKTLMRIVPSKRGIIFEDMFIENCIGTASVVLLRKKCFAKIGLFDENISYGEDYDMWLRISREFQFEYIIDSLLKYYVHDNKLSTNYEAMIRGMETIYKKYEQFFALDKKRYSSRYLELGVACCRSGDAQKGRKAFLTGIKLNPFDLRNYFNFLLSFLGRENFVKIKMYRDRLATSSH
jgi:glycosyltransferase involved in cell wall biosynthesis